MKINKCPDCQGELEQGCLIDQGAGVITVQKFARAETQDIKDKIAFDLSELKLFDLRKTEAYRCKKCNRIYQYALDKIEIPDLSKRMRNYWIIILAFITILLVGLLATFFVIST